MSFRLCHTLPRIVAWAILAMFAMLIVQSAAHAQRSKRPYRPPDDIRFRHATIISEGTRMAAELFSPKQAAADEKLPTIIMSHGWGGTAAHLRPDAVVFARAGYLVLTFDYRGWGASDSRVILTGPPPDDRSDGRFTAEVREVREVVDPIDQTTDLLNAIHWIQAEPQCDTDRIGLWGSSYSGGHVIYAAARDPRVKATVSQVPAMDSRNVLPRARCYEEATRRTRGQIGYPPPGARVLGNLRGAPIVEKFLRYAPVEDAGRAPHCAMLFVLAENEELFDNREHGIRAYELARGPKRLVVIPGIRHYDIYLGKRQEAQRLAIEWYDQHLKQAQGSAP